MRIAQQFGLSYLPLHVAIDRKLIEKAKGILMRTANLAEDAAMRKLQKMASDTNRKLIVVAQMIVDAAPTLDLLNERGK